MTTITDTDKSGHGFQKQKVWLGPSLGWSEEYVQPSTLITSGPTYAVQPGDGMLLIDVAGPITIQLPDVRKWFQQVANQPATGWNRQICIKDFGGNASTFNIVVQPFGGQRIDKAIGTTSITVSNSTFLLVPNVDLTGWVLAAGTTVAQLPVGSFLPVHNPRATGTFTVGEIGGNFAQIQGSAAGQQGVLYGVDPTSVDAAVNVHILPKGAAGVNLYSNGALQLAVSGPPVVTDYLVISGAGGLADPIIANAGGGPIRIDDSILVGPPGGNFAGLEGSANGQMSVAVRADNVTNPDANINISIIPKGVAGVNLYSNGSLQAIVVGPAATTRVVALQGSVAGNPTISAAFGGVIEIPNLNMTGIPTCPTASVGTSTTQVASTAFVIANAGGGGGGGNVSNAGTPLPGQFAMWVDATHILGQDSLAALGPTLANYLPLSGGTLTGKLFMGSAAADPAGGNSFVINGTSSPTTGIGIWEWFNDGSAGRILAGKSRGGTVGTHGLVQQNDRLFDIGIYASDGAAWKAAASIFAFVDAAAAANKVPAALAFSNTDRTSGTFTQRMQMASDGTVYIGQGPFGASVNQGLLQIDGISGGQSTISVTNYQAAAGAANLVLRHSRGALGTHGAVLANDPLGNLSFGGSDGAAWITGAQIGITAQAAPSGGHIPSRMMFITDDGVNLNEKMRLFASGGLSLQSVAAFPTDPGIGNIIAGLITSTGFSGPTIGVPNNSLAAAGQVGEQAQGTVASVSFGAANAITVLATVSLPAGDWDVTALVTVQATTTALVELEVSSASLTGTPMNYISMTVPATANGAVSIPNCKFPLSTTTTINLMGRANATGVTANAALKARRER